MSERKHYMTLCIRNNTEITYTDRNGVIEVTFEEAINGGFKTLILDIDANILVNEGYNVAEVNYFIEFLKKNRSCIIQESEGLI